MQDSGGSGNEFDKYRLTPDSMVGMAPFPDTGRMPNNPGETIDSLVGAPARQAIQEAQNGNLNWSAVKKIFHQIGSDPQTAPTGYDIASKITDNPYLGTFLATAVDLGAQMPGVQHLTPGVIGEIRGVKNIGPKIADALEAFAERGKMAPSLETKIAKMNGEMGTVSDAVPKLAERAKEDLGIAAKERQATRDTEWANKKAMREKGETPRAKAIIQEIEDARTGHEEYERGDGADDYNHYMWEDKRNLKDLNIGPDTQDLVDWAKSKGFHDDHIFRALKKHSSIETGGIFHPDEHMASFPLGEREIQVDGLGDKLNELTPEEQEHVNWEQGAKPGNDYIYHDMNDTVHYSVPDLEATKKTLSRIPKNKRAMSTEDITAPSKPQLSAVPNDEPDNYAHGGTVVPHAGHMPMPSQQEYNSLTSPPPGFSLDQQGPQQDGGELPPGFELDEDKYGGIGGQAASAGLGFASGATLGLSDVALTKSGMMSPDTLKAYQDTNPIAHGAGELASVFIPGGAAEMIGKAGKATYQGMKALTAMKTAETAGRAAKLLGVGADIGSQALGSAVEGSLYAGTSNTLNEYALGDPDLNAEKVIANFGHGALFGGAVGTALKTAAIGAPPALQAGKDALTGIKNILIGAGEGGESLVSKALDKMAPESGLSDMFRNRSINLDVDQQAGLINEVVGGLNTVKNNFSTMIKDLNQILRPAERSALIETAKPRQVLEATQEVHDKLVQTMDEIKLNPAKYSGGILKDLEDMRVQVANNLKKQDPLDRFDLLKGLKQLASDWGQGAANTLDVLNTKGLFKNIGSFINERLTNPDVFGMAGASEAAHNELLANIYKYVSPNGRAREPLQKEFKKLFLGSGGDFDSSKVKRMMDKQGPEGDRARQLLDEWFDLQRKLPEHFENTLANVPNDLWDKSKLDKVMDTLNKTHGDIGLANTQYADALERTKGKNLDLRNILLGGIGVSHPLVGGAMFVGDVASRPLEYINKLATIERVAGKTTDGISKGAKAIFTPTLKGIGKVKGPLINDMTTPTQEEFKKTKNDLSQLSNNPQMLIDKLHQATGSMQDIAPDTAMGVQQGLTRGAQFLASKLPGSTNSNPFEPEYEPSKLEMAKFQRYHDIVENPMLALKQISQGAVGPETIETLQSVYPKLYEHMKSEVMNAAIAAASSKESIPFATKQQVGFFLGQPIDQAFSANSVMANQQTFAMSTQQHQAQQGGLGKPGNKGMEKLTIAERSKVGKPEAPS